MGWLLLIMLLNFKDWSLSNGLGGCDIDYEYLLKFDEFFIYDDGVMPSSFFKELNYGKTAIDKECFMFFSYTLLLFYIISSFRGVETGVPTGVEN